MSEREWSKCRRGDKGCGENPCCCGSLDPEECDHTGEFKDLIGYRVTCVQCGADDICVGCRTEDDCYCEPDEPLTPSVPR